jgi:hypothetical protein
MHGRSKRLCSTVLGFCHACMGIKTKRPMIRSAKGSLISLVAAFANKCPAYFLHQDPLVLCNDQLKEGSSSIN